jgi:hypothetical protein
MRMIAYPWIEAKPAECTLTPATPDPPAAALGALIAATASHSAVSGGGA